MHRSSHSQCAVPPLRKHHVRHSVPVPTVKLRRRVEIMLPAAAAYVGRLAASVLEKFLEIVLLFLRNFLRARARFASTSAADLATLFRPAALERYPQRR